MSVLPDWPLLSAFLFASLVLAVTPGPGVFYIVARTLAQGRGSGLASVAGVALGNLSAAIVAGVGLSALLAASAVAFTIVKYAGAAYLIWLGVQTLRAPRAGESKATGRTAPNARVFRDGYIVALLNPKTALFFAAFLPQFMSATAAPVVQSFALGALFVLIAAGTDATYVLAAGAVAPRLGRLVHRGAGRWFSGCAFIGLGVFAAVGGPRDGT